MDVSSEFKESRLVSEAFSNLKSSLHLHRFSQIYTVFLILLADLFSTYVSIKLAVKLFRWFNFGRIGFDTSSLGLIIPTFIIVFAFLGLYRLRGINEVDELRLLTRTITIIYAILINFYLLIHQFHYTIEFLSLSWVIAVVLFPLSRWAVRRIGSSQGIWGEPVVVVGNGSISNTIVYFLLKNLYCGMRPVVVVDVSSENALGEEGKNGLPIPILRLGNWASISHIGSQLGISTAILVIPDIPSINSASIARGEHLGFSKIITVTQQFNTRNLGLMPLDFGGIVGLEEPHYELSIIDEWKVRILDLILIVLMIPILVPIFIFITAAINIESKGGIFYRQTRIGRNGRKFKVVKFRTMHKDADTVLAKYLEENPSMQAEWNENYKLKDDPRITRIGKFLRKTSLDELPQLWNVFKGEMSLVGPRPIVADEIVRYAEKYQYYCQVPPGITGLWQVSGRSDIDYEQRVCLDEYYVRNRSIWMNLLILVRTGWIVLRRQGAY